VVHSVSEEVGKLISIDEVDWGGTIIIQMSMGPKS
jgi:hypothetical protein